MSSPILYPSPAPAPLPRYAVGLGLTLAVAAALAYLLIAWGVLGVGDLQLAQEGGAIVYVAAAGYLLGGLLILLRNRWLWTAGLILNGVVILFFFQLYSDRPSVVLSPGGLVSKAVELLLELTLVYLIVAQWLPNAAAARRFHRGLALTLVLLLVALSGVPVLLLPLSTAVPVWVWLPLLVLGGLMVAALFWSKWQPWVVGGALAGAALATLLAVWTSQVFAATPPIRDAQGQPVPGSLATLEKVNLNGTDQWITIRGWNPNNPILLNLGMGGPGGGGFATRTLFTPLEQHFTVVSWDEPHTGKSYGAVPAAELTRDRFVADAYALTQLLRERFHQDKIYVYGVSWSSIVGVWLVQQYPDLYYAYIGNGQMVNTTENDQLGYQLALDYSTDLDDSGTVALLRRNGPPPYDGAGLVYKYLAFLDVLNVYMNTPKLSLVVPLVPFFAPEYGLVDKVNHTRGLLESFDAVYPQLRDLDFETQAATLDVPVYLFAGRNDVNAMSSLVERYFAHLQAPEKHLIWLEGGHGLDANTMDQFASVLINQVRRHSPDAPVVP